MLATIKSSYFVKNIFFILDERRKLKLIKYNKQIQNKLKIDLINYILFSNKFIIYENKTKGYEYLRDGDKPNPYDENSDNRKWRRGKKLHPLGALIYEGEFLNGERNGKGKELGLNTLKFEGKYLNGKRNGKGKEYYDRNIIKFEGEYLKGKRWNGKKYDYDKNILYELHNGNVYIKKYFLEKLIFEGEYLNGEKYGIIKEYDINGNIKFEGEYLNGKRNGKGKEYLDNILIFEGEYINGKRNGKGKEYYDDCKLRFEGKYLNDKEWIGNRYDWNGNILYTLNNNINGNGKEYNDGGKLIFEGEYLNDKEWIGNGYLKMEI